MFFLPGLTAGGSEHVVTFNANRLVARGYRVTIVTCEQEGSRPYYPCDPRVDVRYLGLPVGQGGKANRLVDPALRVLALRRLIREVRPDMLVSFLTRTNIIAVFAGTGLGIPVIVSERNNPERQRVGLVWQSLRRLAYARSFGLVTMTRGALNYFPEVMRPRGWVIPNMADWQHFKPSGRNDAPVLTAVGRLTEQKGFDLLIAAFAAIAAHHPEWKLRIWGEGSLRPALLAQIAAAGMQDRIELAGLSVKPGSWIESADAFVLSSRYEGWGLVLGEAMAAGLPCVSFDCPFGPADMITDGVDGLLAVDGDVDSLADALSKVMGDGQLRSILGRNARSAAERFAPEAIGAQWEDLIRSVLASARARKSA